MSLAIQLTRQAVRYVGKQGTALKTLLYHWLLRVLRALVLYARFGSSGREGKGQTAHARECNISHETSLCRAQSELRPPVTRTGVAPIAAALARITS